MKQASGVARLIGGILALLISLTGEGASATPYLNKDTPFEVVASTLHADGPQAEFCLSLSKPADTSNRWRLVSFLSLEKDGHESKIDPTDLSVSAQDICIQNLEHRHTYRLKMRKLAGRNGENLASSFSKSFAVPDRKESLSFVRSGPLAQLPRHKNEQKTSGKIEQDFLSDGAHILHSVNVPQTHLVLYRIAKREDFSGAWQQFKSLNLSPSESLNFARDHGSVVFESDLVFEETPNKDQTLVAPLPEETQLQPGLYYLAAAPSGKEKSNPALFAGQWFLVSDLYMTALWLDDGVQIFAVQGASKDKPAEDVSITILGHDGATLQEGKTDKTGRAFLAFSSQKDREKATLVSGLTKTGATDLIEKTPERVVALTDLSLQASMVLDRESYLAGEKIGVVLYAEDQEGLLSSLQDSVLKLVRSDGAVHSELPVSGQQSLPAFLIVPLPALGENVHWRLVWETAKGRLLAEKQLSIYTKSSRDDYFSGVGFSTDGQQEKKQETPFSSQTRKISGFIIKPLIESDTFPENNPASFAIRAVDFYGQPRNAADLYYLFYEEGRSFEWFPAEGHWDYKPLPYQRRIGGGNLSLSSKKDAIISWPVTAGHYILEITAENGHVLAQYPFKAGRAAPYLVQPDKDRLQFLPQANAQPPLTLNLSTPTMAGFLATDGKNHYSFLKKFPAGRQEMELPALSSEWGRQILVRAEAFFPDTPFSFFTRAFLKNDKSAEPLSVFVSMPRLVISGQKTTLEAQIKGNGKQPAKLMALLRFLPDRQQEDPAMIPAPVFSAATETDKEGRAKLALDLPAYKGKAIVEVWGWENKKIGHASFPTEVRPSFIIEPSFNDLKIGVPSSLKINIETQSKMEGDFSYSLRLPKGLSSRDSLKGTIKLLQGTTTLALPVLASRFVEGDIHFTLKGADKEFKERWPLHVGKETRPFGVQTVLPLEAGQEKTVTLKTAKDSLGGTLSPALLVMPEGTLGLFDGLWDLLTQKTDSTEDIALWLTTVKAWQKPVEAWSLMSPTRLEQLFVTHLSDLQDRQNEDGGFRQRTKKGASDLRATAWALIALQNVSPVSARMAAQWLSAKMENTWFEEEQRADRAIAFYALARTKQLDIATLRYFAQTSQDKPLPFFVPDVLASTFLAAEDKDQARIWQEQALRQAEQTEPESVFLGFFWQTMNTYQSTEKLRRFVQQQKEIPQEPHQRLLFLAALGTLQQRGDAFSFDIDGQRVSLPSGGMLPLDKVGQPVKIKNYGPQPTALIYPFF